MGVIQSPSICAKDCQFASDTSLFAISKLNAFYEKIIIKQSIRRLLIYFNYRAQFFHRPLFVPRRNKSKRFFSCLLIFIDYFNPINRTCRSGKRIVRFTKRLDIFQFGQIFQIVYINSLP